MKLKIIEYFWAVGRKTKRVGTYRMPLDVGQTREINRMSFKIEKVDGDKLTVSINRKDGTLIKEISVEKGKQSYYRPMSMDAGYEYILKITRLF